MWGAGWSPATLWGRLRECRTAATPAVPCGAPNSPPRAIGVLHIHALLAHHSHLGAQPATLSAQSAGSCGGQLPSPPEDIHPSLSHQVPARGCSIFITSLFPTPGPLPQHTELKHSSSSRTMLVHRLPLRWMNGTEGRSLFWMDTALWMDARLGKWRVGGISAPTHLLCQVSLCSVLLAQLYRAALRPPSPLAVFHPFTSQPKFVLLREAPL